MTETATRARTYGESQRDFLPIRTPRGGLLFLPPSVDATPEARALVHEFLWHIPSDLFPGNKAG